MSLVAVKIPFKRTSMPTTMTLSAVTKVWDVQFVNTYHSKNFFNQNCHMKKIYNTTSYFYLGETMPFITN